MKQKFFILTCALLTFGFISLSNASDTATPKTPQAQIVKTPEEKAKAAELAKTYTLTTCPVSGDKIGDLGEPIDTLYQGQLIRFCCKGCIKSFNKNPDKYLKVIDAAKKPAA